ncbi:unnamed protein product, partial [Mesorhabditis spiculigera]
MSRTLQLCLFLAVLSTVALGRKCYNCSSFDPHCDDNYARYLIDCPPIKVNGQEKLVVGCRKIDQWVYDEHTMFR